MSVPLSRTPPTPVRAKDAAKIADTDQTPPIRKSPLQPVDGEDKGPVALNKNNQKLEVSIRAPTSERKTASPSSSRIPPPLSPAEQAPMTGVCVSEEPSKTLIGNGQSYEDKI